MSTRAETSSPEAFAVGPVGCYGFGLHKILLTIVGTHALMPKLQSKGSGM